MTHIGRIWDTCHGVDIRCGVGVIVWGDRLVQRVCGHFCTCDSVNSAAAILCRQGRVRLYIRHLAYH